MDLKLFLKSLPDDAGREAFAAACGTTIGHLRNIMYGLRTCSAELATSIEAQSCGSVTRKDMCPESWPRIWPELIGAAPKEAA